MKKFWSLVRFIIFLLVVTSLSFFMVNRLYSRYIKGADNNTSVKQGSISIVNMDAVTELPLKNSEFRITDIESGEIVQVLITNQEGIATSGLLNYDSIYTIEQISVPKAYELVDEVKQIEIIEDSHELIIKNNILEHVKNTRRLGDGTLEITGVYLPVDVLMQNPELPNGCEITSLTAVLNSYGYEVSKTQMADAYLPKLPFYRINERLYGANPYEAFAGDPAQTSGFFVYAPPIVEATNQYFYDVGGNKEAINISGSTREEIMEHLDKGRPVVTWVTLELTPPRLNYSWYFDGTEEEFIAPINLHAVVLNGYDEENVYVMDPLKGQITRNIEAFFRSYIELGMHAVVVIES